MGAAVSPADSNLIAHGVNALNAKRTKRAEAAAHFVLFVVMVILGAAAMVHYLTPCDVGQLCMVAAITPTRAGLISRWVNSIRAAYLRQRIAWAETDIDVMQHSYESLPAQMAAHRLWLDQRRVELIGLELLTRNN